MKHSPFPKWQRELVVGDIGAAMVSAFLEAGGDLTALNAPKELS